MSAAYIVLVGMAVALHFLYLGVLIFGGLGAQRWPRLLGAHLAALVWGLGAVVLRYDCPLTSVELELRERAGLAVYHDGFIRHYIRGELFPERVTPFVVAAIVGLVLAGWVRFASRASGRTPASGFR